MSRHLITPIKHSSTGDRARSLSRLILPDRTRSGPFASGGVRFRGVEHRDGGGHLAPTYEAELRASVQDRARKSEPLAFVSGMSSVDPDAEESGEEFVLTVTSGEDGGRAAGAEDNGEKGGGHCVEINARARFAHDTEQSD